MTHSPAAICADFDTHSLIFIAAHANDLHCSLDVCADFDFDFDFDFDCDFDSFSALLLAHATISLDAACQAGLAPV